MLTLCATTFSEATSLALSLAKHYEVKAKAISASLLVKTLIEDIRENRVKQVVFIYVVSKDTECLWDTLLLGIERCI